jgi:hypothetical protein
MRSTTHRRAHTTAHRTCPPPPLPSMLLQSVQPWRHLLGRRSSSPSRYELFCFRLISKSDKPSSAAQTSERGSMSRTLSQESIPVDLMRQAVNLEADLAKLMLNVPESRKEVGFAMVYCSVFDSDMHADAYRSSRRT